MLLLPVVTSQTFKPFVPSEAPAIGEAPMAPRADFEVEDEFIEDMEPEELPSIFSVYHPKVVKKKVKAKKPAPKVKPKAKVKAKVINRTPPSKKKMAARRK